MRKTIYKFKNEVNEMKRDITAEREIYIDGKRLMDGQELPYWISNPLSTVIDEFEDDENEIIDGYEVYKCGRFTIRRKCAE
jgi:hypothetical protein